MTLVSVLMWVAIAANLAAFVVNIYYNHKMKQLHREFVMLMTDLREKHQRLATPEGIEG